MKLRKRLLFLLCAFGFLLSGGTIACTAAEDNGFTDVPADSWYTEAVAYCRDNGIMSGVSDTAFAPYEAMSRAMLATVLWRMAGSGDAEGPASYEDVTAGAWYFDAVCWTAEAGIISGYSDTVFGADDSVTREQLVTMLYRYEQHRKGAANVSGKSGFADDAEISDWAKEAVTWAAEAGIVAGRDENRFDPQAGASRAEASQMLHRYRQMETPPPETAGSSGNGAETVEDGMLSVDIVVGGTVFAARFYDNNSARAIISQMPFSLDMDDYAGQEKVRGLTFDLPDAAAVRPDTINTGELYLWSGNSLVLFYTAFSNAYSYIPVGYIEDTAGLKEALGGGSVTVAFSLS